MNCSLRLTEARSVELERGSVSRSMFEFLKASQLNPNVTRLPKLLRLAEARSFANRLGLPAVV